MSTTTDKLVSVRKAAEQLGYEHPNSVHRLIAAKKLAAVKRGEHGRLLVPQSAIDKYLRQNLRPVGDTSPAAAAEPPKETRTRKVRKGSVNVSRDWD